MIILGETGLTGMNRRTKEEHNIAYNLWPKGGAVTKCQYAEKMCTKVHKT